MIKQLYELVKKAEDATFRAIKDIEKFYPDDIETISFHKGSYKTFKFIAEYITKLIQSSEKHQSY